jgi:phenylacetate-CoA ligase
MTVKVEVDKKYFSGEMKQMETLRKKIVEELKGEILITPKIDLVEPDSIPKGEGKAVRVIDNRKD